MTKRLRDLYDRVRESLFLVPALVVLGFGGLAWLLVWVDNEVGLPEWLPLLPTTVASARAILSTVAGATITVAAIVFSITALTVQLASTQYSLRIVGVLFRDTFQQVVIGVVTGTFVFSLLVLGSVRVAGDGPGSATPSAAATLAITMAVISMLLIIGFISHVLQRIRLDVLIRRIARETTEEFRKLLPKEKPSIPEDSFSADSLSDEPSVAVVSTKSGWITEIDELQMLKAVEDGGVIRVDVEVGQHLQTGATIATLWSAKTAVDVEGRVREGVSLANNRRIEGDPGFGLRLMADIALKALSPGINDPATAVDVVSHLGEPLAEILTRETPQRIMTDERGCRSFRPIRADRDDYIHNALREIRLNAGPHPDVVAAVIDLAGHLKARLEPGQESRADALFKETDLLLDQAERALRRRTWSR